jgi:hypothetical protein
MSKRRYADNFDKGGTLLLDDYWAKYVPHCLAQCSFSSRSEGKGVDKVTRWMPNKRIAAVHQHCEGCESVPVSTTKELLVDDTLANLVASTKNERVTLQQIKATFSQASVPCVTTPSRLSRALKKVKETTQTPYMASWEYVLDVLLSIKKNNPTACVKLEVDADGKFTRALVAFEEVRDLLLRFGIPLHATDATFTKGDKQILFGGCFYLGKSTFLSLTLISSFYSSVVVRP